MERPRNAGLRICSSFANQEQHPQTAPTSLGSDSRRVRAVTFKHLRNTSKGPKLRHGNSAERCPQPKDHSPNALRRRANAQLPPFLIHHPSELHSGLPTNTLTRQAKRTPSPLLPTRSHLRTSRHLLTHIVSALAVSYPKRLIHPIAWTSYGLPWSTATGRLLKVGVDLLEPGGFSGFKAAWCQPRCSICASARSRDPMSLCVPVGQSAKHLNPTGKTFFTSFIAAQNTGPPGTRPWTSRPPFHRS